MVKINAEHYKFKNQTENFIHLLNMFYLIPQNTEILKYDVKTISFFTLALSPRKPYNVDSVKVCHF